MTGVQTRTVSKDEAGLRLDRWFKRHFPAVGHGRVEKLLRTGQIRIDAKRAKAGDRLSAGQVIRIPPLGEAKRRPPKREPRPVSAADAARLRDLIIHQDDHVIAIDKPAGLAVQGGTGVGLNVDAMLSSLRFEAEENPRLVHRLDQDTSGILLIARTVSAAAHLASAFRTKAAEKIYWAVVVGIPTPLEGRIDLALAKRAGGEGSRERVQPDEDAGKRAVTLYRVLDHSGKAAAWVELQPLTGRTHQLRAHMAALGTPILGDGKYGGAKAFLSGAGIARKVHLHARYLRIPHPAGGMLELEAPPSAHLSATFEALGFDLQIARPSRRR